MYEVNGTYIVREDEVIVTHLSIKGHANSCNILLNKEVCAVISTFTKFLENTTQNVVELKRGSFIYEMKYDAQYVNYFMFTFIVIIKYLQHSFPELFASVNIYEKGSC